MTKRTQHIFNGAVLGTQSSAEFAPPIFSPSRRYIATTQTLGYVEFRYYVRTIEPGPGIPKIELSTGLGATVAVNDQGALFATDSTSLSILPFGGTDPLPPIDIGIFNWAVLSPATQELLVGRPSLIEAISATAARRVFARLPGLNCPQAQASTDGGLVLGCESEYPFWSLTAAGELRPIPLAVPIPRAWILASDGDVLWLVD